MKMIRNKKYLRKLKLLLYKEKYFAKKLCEILNKKKLEMNI